MTDAPVNTQRAARPGSSSPGEILAEAMGRSEPLERYQTLLPRVAAALRDCECTTVDRIAMWMAQLGHESGGLTYMEEIADGSAYEGRTDLGNIQAGDGPRYKGRGPIQLTGRDNYAAVSLWAHGRNLVPSPTFFVDEPGRLAGDRFGFLGVVWYWTVARDLNAFADGGDLEGATRAINGGLHGIKDRRARWKRCRRLGTRLLTVREVRPT